MSRKLFIQILNIFYLLLYNLPAKPNGKKPLKPLGHRIWVFVGLRTIDFI